MTARILTTATLLTVFTGVLPAVDHNLLNLLAPDSKILAGVNVAQAKNSPFGKYVLAQMGTQEQEMQKLALLTGFDPRQDVIELLVASNGVPKSQTGLAVATGTFNVGAITTAATTHGAATETYKGVTILEDPNATGTPGGIAFLGSTIVVAGDLASVKAAIDRQSAPQSLPSNVKTLVDQLSGSEDAWVLTMVPPATLVPPPTAPQIPGLTGQNTYQQVQQASAGVKFGANIVVNAQAITTTAQDATNMAGVLQLLANLAQMQSSQNPQAAALAKSMTISASGTAVNVSISLPQDQFQQLVAPKPAAKRVRAEKKK